MSRNLHPHKYYNEKALNTEDYKYQEQNITLFTCDDRYLKQIGN